MNKYVCTRTVMLFVQDHCKIYQEVVQGTWSQSDSRFEWCPLFTL